MFFFICGCTMCVPCPWRSEKGIRFSRSWTKDSWEPLWPLCGCWDEPRFSARAARGLNYWDISPAPISVLPTELSAEHSVMFWNVFCRLQILWMGFVWLPGPEWLCPPVWWGIRRGGQSGDCGTQGGMSLVLGRSEDAENVFIRTAR